MSGDRGSAVRPNDLGRLLDDLIYPALFNRMDGAFPEFGWIRRGDNWVASNWPPNISVDAEHKNPDRLTVYSDRPWWIKVHGRSGVRFLDLVSEGRRPVAEEFVNAVRRLAELAGIPFPKREVTPGEAAAARAREDRSTALEGVAEAASDALWATDGGQAAQAFLHERGFTDDDIHRFGLGYYMAVDDMRDRLRAAGHNLAAVHAAGTMSRTWEGFITIPWRDVSGRMLTIYGRYGTSKPPAKADHAGWRDRGDDGTPMVPKTLALPGEGTKGTPFMLDAARRAGHADFVLVEGVFDALVLHARGDTRTIACVAAQLSGDQVATLERVRTKSVTICLDPDKGGDAGVLSCLRALAKARIPAFVAPRLPDGKDPDEFVIDRGVDEWRTHIDGAVRGSQFLVEASLAGLDVAGEQKKHAAIDSALAIIAALDGEYADIERDDLIAYVAKRAKIKQAPLAVTVKRLVKAREAKSQHGKAQTENKSAPPAGECDHPYVSDERGVWIRKGDGDEASSVQLTNFDARIVEDILIDDGAEERRSFEIEAQVGPQRIKVEVAATHFEAMNWVIERLGPAALVMAGKSVRDHARAAIQALSGEIPQRRVYAHTGWRQHEDQWCFVHGAGAIGASEAALAATARLPTKLSGVILPSPPLNEELRSALRKSMDLLRLGPPHVVVPIFGAIWTAVLGIVELSVHLVGPTGVFKTELASLVQQHFGASFCATNLPGSWSSTDNATEELAFAAKDIVLVVDDFVPTAQPGDADQLNRKAERLFRAVANSAGRQRMRSDSTLRPPRPPRCLLLSTGEDVPRGQSLVARMVVARVAPGDIDVARLTACQRDAASGVYSAVLAAFVRWLAPNYAETKSQCRQRAIEMRGELAGSAAHRRTPGLISSLAAGLSVWMRFARETQSMTEEEAQHLGDFFTQAYEQIGKQQAAQLGAVEPTRRFLDLLSTLLASGRAHLADRNGEVPANSTAYGWRCEGGSLRGCGERIGWVDGTSFYLDSQVAHAAVQRLARDGGEPFAVSLLSLKQRLRDMGLLVSSDTRREELTTRRKLQGATRKVLHLSIDALGIQLGSSADVPSEVSELSETESG